MAKIIRVDFTDRGKDLYRMKKNRQEEKKWQKREDRFYQLLEIQAK